MSVRHGRCRLVRESRRTGHTDIQFDRPVNGIRIINAGSVGMPYERSPGAYWALLGPDVEFKHVAYDHEPLRKSSFPSELPHLPLDEATAATDCIGRQRDRASR